MIEGGSMFRRWALVGALLSAGMWFAGPASAESYRLISGSSNALMVADMDSVRRTGDVARFTTVMFSRRLETFSGRSSWATRSTNEINCRTNQRLEIDSGYLAEGGALITRDARAGEWQSLPPGSVGTSIRSLICDGRATENNIAFGDSFGRAEQMAGRVLGH